MRLLLLTDEPASFPVQHEVAFLRGSLDRERLQPRHCTLRPSTAADLTITARGWLDPAAVHRLYRAVRAEGSELIHALDLPTLHYATAVALVADVPLLVSLYGATLRRSLEGRTLQRWYWQALGRVITRVIVPSDVVRRQLWMATSFPKERIEVVYPSMSVPAVPHGDAPGRAALDLPDGPLATVITPDEPDDGYDLIFEAMVRVKQRVGEVHFVCAGDASIIKGWQRKLSSIRPAPPIRWLPDPPDLNAVIAASDVILAHPQRETWPSAVALAALLGKPVVASRAGGVPEIVEPEITGLLVTPGDVRDFALQTIRLLTQPTFAERLGADAQTRARQMFALDKRRDTMTELYEATIYATR
jgi:glycosyltransferase involved in cell wall biosynthesis